MLASEAWDRRLGRQRQGRRIDIAIATAVEAIGPRRLFFKNQVTQRNGLET